MSAKCFFEIPFQDIEKPKCHGWTNGRMDGLTDGQWENSISPTQIVGGIIRGNNYQNRFQ